MPIFGEYETVGEPHAVTQAREYVTTVWRARKSGDSGDRKEYAVKCVAPRQHGSRGAAASPDDLDRDRGLEFIEVVKQIKKAQTEGGRGLAPIHEFGAYAEGVWYATDFCERQSLKALVTRQGRVDDAALRHVVYSVAAGCLALKRFCSRSHGNLKLSNVLRAGATQPLRKTPLLLVDPMPVPSATIFRLANPDRHSVSGLLHDVFEAQDLKAIGEIILQLVEGRVIESGFDYNYPVATSAAWDRLGKAGESWRNLCNQLLDPQLSLEKVNLSWLEQQYQPKPTGRYLAIFGGVLVLAGLAAGGFIYSQHRGQSNPKPSVSPPPVAAAPKPAEAQPSKPEVAGQNDKRAYQTALTEGRNALTALNYELAVEKADLALGFKPGDKAAAQLKAAAQNQQATAAAARLAYQNAIAEGTSALKALNYDLAVDKADTALGFKPGDEIATRLKAEAKSQQAAVKAAQAQDLAYQTAMAEGRAALKALNYDLAVEKADAALALKRGDTFATQLRTDAKSHKAAAEVAQEQEQAYQTAMAEGRNALKALNYDLAVEKADVALAIKRSDPSATQLKTDAKSQQAAAKAAQEQEQAYQTAMTDGRAALKASSYELAVQKADAALAIKRGDPSATQLKKDAKSQQAAAQAAQEQEQAYQTAMTDGRAALKASNYELAVQKADVALVIKHGDSSATQLKTDAKSQQAAAQAAQEQEQAYQTVMTDGRAALKASNYELAVQKADAALVIKHGDSSATQLKTDAKSQQAAAQAAQEQEQAYQTAMTDGRAALKASNYELAVQKAAAALAIKRGDPAATQLKTDATSQQAAAKAAQDQDQAYQTAMTDGRAALKASNYELAVQKADAALAIRLSDPAATQLKAAAAQQQAAQKREQDYQLAMTEGTNALKGANYQQAIEKANTALANKRDDPAATALLNQATQGKSEQDSKAKFADYIKTANTLKVDAPLQALEALNAARASQQPLNQATLDLENEIKDLRSLDVKLEDLMRRFGVKASLKGKAVDPKNSKAPVLNGAGMSDYVGNNPNAIAELKKQYKDNKYKDNDWLNTERNDDFDRLTKAFNNAS